MTEYSQTVLDHFTHPRNVGALRDPDGAATATDPVCGDEVRIHVRIREETVEDARFLTFGCSAAIACASMVTVLAKGRALEQARAITAEDVIAALGGLPETRRHASALAAEALRAALADFDARSDAPAGPGRDTKGGGP